jgi:hypothetical protein
MVTREALEKQLDEIGVNYRGWGRTEIGELPNIILPHEKIYECVNGLYDGGFALIVATNFRVLLIDKKPMRFLTVEDLRFDMINEIDYSHRLIGAQISISAGSKNLKFVSYNQQRLRDLIGHVQRCMAENKQKQANHEEDQKLHLEQINQQLQTYLLAQHQQQQKIQEHLEKNSQQPPGLEPVRPNPELADYLYAQSLLSEYQRQHPGEQVAQEPATTTTPVAAPVPLAAASSAALYQDGIQEVFGKQAVAATSALSGTDDQDPSTVVNPLKVAYSQLPLAMRNRKFGRPSFHAHSQQKELIPQAD